MQQLLHKQGYIQQGMRNNAVLQFDKGDALQKDDKGAHLGALWCRRGRLSKFCNIQR